MVPKTAPTWEVCTATKQATAFEDQAKSLDPHTHAGLQLWRKNQIGHRHKMTGRCPVGQPRVDCWNTLEILGEGRECERSKKSRGQQRQKWLGSAIVTARACQPWGRPKAGGQCWAARWQKRRASESRKKKDRRARLKDSDLRLNASAPEGVRGPRRQNANQHPGTSPPCRAESVTY